MQSVCEELASPVPLLGTLLAHGEMEVHQMQVEGLCNHSHTQSVLFCNLIPPVQLSPLLTTVKRPILNGAMDSGGREGGKEKGREGGREGGKEGGRMRGRERGREEGRKGGRKVEKTASLIVGRARAI